METEIIYILQIKVNSEIFYIDKRLYGTFFTKDIVYAEYFHNDILLGDYDNLQRELNTTFGNCNYEFNTLKVEKITEYKIVETNKTQVN